MDLRGERWQLKKKKARPEEPPKQRPPQESKEEEFRPYKIILTDEAQKGYKNLSANVKQAMDEIMERLKAWPEVSGTRPYFGKGWAPGKFRMKTWDWRIEFFVDQETRTVTVSKIGHRDEFYDEYHY